MEHRQKRQRDEDSDTGDSRRVLGSLSREISPPRKRKREARVVASPWQLTWIRDLPESLNKDAVTLKDLLGDPLVCECWEFNYLHDIPFLMDAFDSDTRHLVKVHVVHGFWKQEDPNRQMLMQEASQFGNVELHTAFMPEMFGTHHSKMMVLFRHDDTAQVIIHTANMIAKDWTNMTNAVWKSPRLPLGPKAADESAASPDQFPVGTGERFKADLLSYLRFYDRRKITCQPLVKELSKYDFSGVRGALIASVPGRHEANDVSQTLWGWSALKRALGQVPCSDGEAEVVVQISSIATLGAKDDWLQKTLFDALSKSHNANAKRPKFKVVFPTADEIRRCLDGYTAGGSIHTRIQSQQQANQLQYLRPMLHHWANDSPGGRALPDDGEKADGGRARAAPHIKTYVRYDNKGSIDWAMLTSANLSKQAWGEAVRSTGEVRISSWEIGVLVWPEMMEKGSVMVPGFQSDTPEGDTGRAVVGVRIPYNVPLQQYGSNEVPWVASMAHGEPDRFGRVWAGY